LAYSLANRRIVKTAFVASSVVVSALAPSLANASDSKREPPQTLNTLHGIATAPQATNIEKDIQALVNFGTRHTLSETESDVRGIGAARRWIKAEFERISADCGGCLEVYFQSDVISGERRIPDPVEVVNVIAI
jgi:hypothetical protein